MDSDKKLINIGAHGLGDCILSLQISKALKDRNVNHINLISTREEVFEPFQHIFSDFELERISPDFTENHAILHQPDLLNHIKKGYQSTRITYNVPSLLFQNPLAFEYEFYGTSPFAIKRSKLLTDKYLYKENIIYCALISSTEGYIRDDLMEIIRKLAEKVPNYTIYLPIVNRWDRNINYPFNLEENLPFNVSLDINPSFNDSLDVLTKSKYCVCVDNGPSHIAYHLGIPRLLLDPQFGRMAHMIRWKEDYEECVPFNINTEEIAEIVYNNIYYPFTASMDKKALLQFIRGKQTNWNEIFNITY